MQIRDYKDEDFEQVDNLLKNEPFYSKNLTTKDNFGKKIEYGPGSIIVAVDNDKIIGVLLFVYDPWYSFIGEMVVDKEYRRKGIGSNLVHTAEQRLNAMGSPEIRGIVSEDNEKALEFWENKGYKTLSKAHHLSKKF